MSSNISQSNKDERVDFMHASAESINVAKAEESAEKVETLYKTHAERDQQLIEEAQNRKEEYSFSHYQLQDALLWLDDILGRGHIKWVLVGDIATQIYEENDPTLEAEIIEVEVLRNDMTQSGRSMISSWIPNARDENLTDIKFDYQGVPVHIKILDEDPGYLGRPDKRFYYVSNINIPNPWEEYINVRNN